MKKSFFFIAILLSICLTCGCSQGFSIQSQPSAFVKALTINMDQGVLGSAAMDENGLFLFKWIGEKNTALVYRTPHNADVIVCWKRQADV
ncbi:MAG: hypothetical protein IJM90_00840 [Firmicutes bacterium]|nr:hypothetical protein [Bacillota bacterium]